MGRGVGARFEEGLAKYCGSRPPRSLACGLVYAHTSVLDARKSMLIPSRDTSHSVSSCVFCRASLDLWSLPPAVYLAFTDPCPACSALRRSTRSNRSRFDPHLCDSKYSHVEPERRVEATTSEPAGRVSSRTFRPIHQDTSFRGERGLQDAHAMCAPCCVHGQTDHRHHSSKLHHPIDKNFAVRLPAKLCSFALLHCKAGEQLGMVPAGTIPN